MKYTAAALGTLLVLPAILAGQIPVLEEKLEYSVNWPSGLSIGEARIETKPIGIQGSAPGQEFLFILKAAIPGFEVADTYRSLATLEYCSVEFEKDFRHGKKAGRERTIFSPDKGTATRQTLEQGGQSHMEVPHCAKDALNFLQYLRREMAAGRVPPPQAVYFGGPYQVRFEYAGRQKITVSEESIEADRINVSLKGPASDHAFQIHLAVEPERRPVLIRVPLPQGPFTMELIF